MIKTPEQYLSSLRDGREVYYAGRRVDDVTRHESLIVPVMHSKKFYELRQRSELRDILIYEEEGLGAVSSFFKIPRDQQGLLDRSRIIQETTRQSNGVFNIVQAIGTDTLFALMIVAKKLEREEGKKEYYERVMRHYEYLAKNDLAMATAQTDVKGDRSKRPHEQLDPDLYLRIVDVTDEGIVVNGAKAHTTQSLTANEIFFIPCRAMTEKDRDYAVAFALPVNTRGLKLIVRPLQEVDGLPVREDAPLSSRNAEAESLTILDHVLVPWERVFLFREWRYAGELANLFALFHRFTAVSYRTVVSELFIGGARLAALCNGIENSPHVRDELLDMVLYREIMHMAAKMAAVEHVRDEHTGIAVPNSLYTNIGKLYSNANFPLVVKDLVDIAGGYVSTLPSTSDLENPETRPYIEKYMKGSPRFSGRDRYRVLRFARELVGGPLAGYMLGLMIHAEGSVAASKIALYREYSFEEAERLATRAALLESE